MQQDFKQIAYQHFGLQLPVQRDVLKAVYRKAARRVHPDLSSLSKEASEAAFRELQAAYDLLTASTAMGVFIDGPSVAMTVEGTPLDDLGKGLGALINGKECKECKGVGYHQQKEKITTWFPYEPCFMCVFTRTTWGCTRCSHLNFSHGDKVVSRYHICAPCKGMGEIEIYNPVIPKGFLAQPVMGQKARKRAGLQ